MSIIMIKGIKCTVLLRAISFIWSDNQGVYASTTTHDGADIALYRGDKRSEFMEALEDAIQEVYSDPAAPRLIKCSDLKDCIEKGELEEPKEPTWYRGIMVDTFTGVHPNIYKDTIVNVLDFNKNFKFITCEFGFATVESRYVKPLEEE